MTRDQLQQIFSRYLDEDIGSGDHSTLSSIDKEAKGTCRLLAKQEGIIAGLEIIHELFQFTDP